MSLGADDSAGRRGHGGRAGDDSRDSGRGHVSRRHQARHHPSVRSGDDVRSHDPGRISSSPTSRSSSTPGGRRARIEVTNRGDRPVQVGSHCHFFEVNRCLAFDRAAAYGMRLNIAAGTAVRFEPGDTREVELVALGGTREVFGLNRLVEGRARRRGGPRRPALERRVEARSRKTLVTGTHENRSPHLRRPLRPDDRRSHPPGRHRPHHPDRARLRRSTATRRSSAAARSFATAWASRRRRAAPTGSPDLVITNVVIVDSTGIRKADVGIRDGRIAAIGKAGNPGVMDGVTPGLEIGASTEVLAGEGHILTAGAIDSHVHFISPNQIPDAFYSGITTLIGGGTGPATGHEGDDLHAGRVEHPADVRSGRSVSAELRLSRQGQRVGRRARCASRFAPARSA